MKTVSVTELKAHLSRYLRMARQGSEVQILERGVPIARLIGPQWTASRTDRERLERLCKAGILRPGMGDFAWLLAGKRGAAANVELPFALADDREDRF